MLTFIAGLSGILTVLIATFLLACQAEEAKQIKESFDHLYLYVELLSKMLDEIEFANSMMKNANHDVQHLSVINEYKDDLMRSINEYWELARIFLSNIPVQNLSMLQETDFLHIITNMQTINQHITRLKLQ